MREVVTVLGGRGGHAVQRPAISYHALLADIPMSRVQAVLSDGLEAIDLLTTGAIMMVSPSRPMTFRASEPIELPETSVQSRHASVGSPTDRSAGWCVSGEPRCARWQVGDRRS